MWAACADSATSHSRAASAHRSTNLEKGRARARIRQQLAQCLHMHWKNFRCENRIEGLASTFRCGSRRDDSKERALAHRRILHSSLVHVQPRAKGGCRLARGQAADRTCRRTSAQALGAPMPIGLCSFVYTAQSDAPKPQACIRPCFAIRKADVSLKFGSGHPQGRRGEDRQTCTRRRGVEGDADPFRTTLRQSTQFWCRVDTVSDALRLHGARTARGTFS